MYLSFFEALIKADEFNIFLRLLTAVLLGAGVGISKDIFIRPTGFRASIVVAIASCLLTIVGVYEFNESAGLIIGSVVLTTGLVTLGVINNNRGDYIGIINACMIIVSGVIGITCASGMYFAAVCTTLITVLAMVALRTVEKSLVTKGYVLNIIIDSRTPALKDLLLIFERNHLTTSSIESKIVLYERNECVKIRVEFIRATSKFDIENVIPVIKEQINPLSITMRNDTYGIIK